MSAGPVASRRRRAAGILRGLALVALTLLSAGWSAPTIRYVSWSAVEFFPPDLRRHVRRHHRRFDAGIERGLQAPPAWRAGPPGRVREALLAHAQSCSDDLRRPVPLEELVEELGVLAVHVLDANDPLAIGHGDPREPQYAAAFDQYVDSIRGRVRLVYYGQDAELIRLGHVEPAVARALERSRSMYPFVGDEFFRTGSLRDWRQIDDRSVAFGVAAVSMSRALTDLANFTAHVWHGGGGAVPPPRPTPEGHVGPTVTLAPALEGGFPDRERKVGRPVIPGSTLRLPDP